jgi:hypothetical protein
MEKLQNIRAIIPIIEINHKEVGGKEMNWIQDYVLLREISQRVTQLVNEHGDEIELETIQYKDHYHAVATICQDKAPFKDFFAEAVDYHSEKEAARKALKELYRQAYSLS